MADFTLIREEGHGYARRLVIRLPERDWEAQPGDTAHVIVLENAIIEPHERV